MECLKNSSGIDFCYACLNGRCNHRLRATCFLSFNELGGGLIKQRVARPGQGKSGGFAELSAWQRIGRAYLGLDDEGLEAAADELMEVSYGEED